MLVCLKLYVFSTDPGGLCTLAHTETGNGEGRSLCACMICVCERVCTHVVALCQLLICHVILMCCCADDLKRDRDNCLAKLKANYMGSQVGSRIHA